MRRSHLYFGTALIGVWLVSESFPTLSVISAAAVVKVAVRDADVAAGIDINAVREGAREDLDA